MSTTRNSSGATRQERSPRERLLEAADELFYGAGIRATGVDALLERAHVARKTLYHQFGGKDGLIVAYLRARDDRWRAHWQAAVEARADPMDRLLALFDALETWEDGQRRPRGCAFVDALVELADPDHPGAQVVAEHWEAMTAALARLAGAAGAEDPGEAAGELLLIYRGALTDMMVESVPSAIGRARAIARNSLAAHGIGSGVGSG